MEKNEEKKKEENAKTKTTVAKTGKRKVSKTWEAMQRHKCVIIRSCFIYCKCDISLTRIFLYIWHLIPNI